MFQKPSCSGNLNIYLLTADLIADDLLQYRSILAGAVDWSYGAGKHALLFIVEKSKWWVGLDHLLMENATTCNGSGLYNH